VYKFGELWSINPIAFVEIATFFALAVAVINDHKTAHKQERRSLWDRGEMSPPPIFMKGDCRICLFTSFSTNHMHNILEVMSFRLGIFYPVSATTVVCCILKQILCVVSRKKASASGDFVTQTPYQSSAPGLRWGTSVPRPPVFFYVPPIIL